jgi:tetratricopeptide (TPR) repeat protein
VMTDHFIRRTQPQRDLLATIAETTTPEGSVTRVALYYPSKTPPTPASEISMAEAQVKDNGIPRLQALLERYQPNSPEPYLVLADAYDREGNNAEVARWSRQALAKRGNFRPAVVKLVPALFAIRQDAQATKVLEEAVERYPTDDLLLSDLGNAYLRQGEIAKASTALGRALQANPERSESHNLLGVIAVKQGDRATGEHEFREALRSRPDFTEARDNLGSLLAGEPALAHIRSSPQSHGRKVTQANPGDQVRCDLSKLNDLLTSVMQPIADYFSAANGVYAAAREIQSAAPQPLGTGGAAILRGPNVPAGLPNPWLDYPGWRTQMLSNLDTLGTDTSNLLAELPGPCQKRTDPKPSGPWVAPPRRCRNPGDTTAPSPSPLRIPATYAVAQAQLDADYQTFLSGNPDDTTKLALSDSQQSS